MIIHGFQNFRLKVEFINAISLLKYCRVFFFGIVTDEPYFHFVRADCCISLMVWLGLWFAYSSGPTKQ
jgi:uncharacterized protein YfaT (DUF1175 family)